MQAFYGYIEGYFGRSLTWKERQAMTDFLASQGMNTYILAPKEDPFHRVRWREDYPAEEMDRIVRLVEAGSEKGIRVLPAMAPGLSFDYLSEEDYSLLLGKMRAFAERGISVIGLFMDDIDPELPENCLEKFSSLGQVHARLIVRLLEDLRKDFPGMDLWFCPTIYTDEFVEGEAADSPYLIDLAAEIPADVPLLWTGNRVVPQTITPGNIGRVSRLFNGNLVIWDNYYANDYCTLKLSVGPLLGREAGIREMTNGVLLNPTGLFHTDCFMLAQLADFRDTGISNGDSWEERADEFKLPSLFRLMKDFFWSPFGCSVTPTRDQQEKAMNFYHDFLVPWQDPLKGEWFPYLYGFFLDLQYGIRKGWGTLDEAWIDNIYPPLIAAELKQLNPGKPRKTRLEIDNEIILQELQLADAADIFQVIDSQREYLGRWLPFVPLTQQEEDTEAFVRSVVQVPEESREYQFSIRYEGQFAGLVGFKDTDRMNGSSEIGYWLSRDFTGKGVMTRAVERLCRFGFEKLKLNRLIIRCGAENRPSRKIPERIGFTQEGTIRQGEKMTDGRYQDLILYSLLAGEL